MVSRRVALKTKAFLWRWAEGRGIPAVNLQENITRGKAKDQQAITPVLLFHQDLSNQAI